MIIWNEHEGTVTGECDQVMAEASLMLSSLKDFLDKEFGKNHAKDFMETIFEISMCDKKDDIKKIFSDKTVKKEKHYSKYKRGQKFQVEISEVHTHYTDDGKPYNLYRIKGFNTMVFDDYGLDRLVSLAKESK